MKGLCILGATGSIGVSTLDVVRRHADEYKVVALTANTNVYALLNQCMEFKPEYVVLADAAKGIEFKTQIAGTAIADITVLVGAEALTTVATLESVCTVMAAIVGAAGLLPTLAAAQAGKTVLLANKESLVMSGDIFMQAIKDSGAILLPIDSEHNAIFQCMPANYAIGHKASNVKHILLTASGGPFRTTPLKKLADVTVEQAIAHPKWDMGRKISVDSATMMNKGLELIEACLLFDIQVEQIQVVIHPQSIIHSMVAYVDGSVLAQMGNPDMRIPIAHAMAWPDRFDSGATPLDIFAVKKMDFEATDLQRFPCLRLAMEAISAGGIMPTVLNAANEFAVEAFLNEQIRFTDIPLVIENSMEKFSPIQADSLEHILKIDQQARQQADQVIATIIA